MADRIELQPDETIIFIGDSITDADRRHVGVDPLGRGYVFFAANLILARYPHLNLNIINAGADGDTTRSLKWRWDADCLRRRPDILSIMIGINDLWYQHAELDLRVKGVPVDEYRDNCRYMLETARAQCDSRIVLMEPFMFCNDPQNKMFADLRNYIEVLHTLAAEFDALLVPLQHEIDAMIFRVPPKKWAQDMVHPYTWAHAWIAQTWLNATKL